jgi:DNA-binding LytR/AlgR family response regulator
MNAIPHKVRCILVDDEPHALAVLKTYIQAVPSLEVAAECSHALAAFEFCQHHQVDLIFLDIQMPQLTGIDFVKSLPKPPLIIVTTAHPDYALEGFELGVVDYLMKPVSMDRFLKAVYRVTQQHHAELDENHFPVNERFLYFRADRKMNKVLLRDILFVESLKDYVRIVTVNGQIITKQSISSVEEMLPEDEFIRIHRSFIIALNKIDSYTNTDVYVGKTELPIGPLYKHEIGKRLRITTS